MSFRLQVLTDLDLAYAFSLGLVFWVGDKVKDILNALTAAD
jgi:hypothetical protein